MIEKRLEAPGFCPIPIIETRKAIAQMSRGDVLFVVFRCDAFPVDIRVWCEANGHEIEMLDDVGAGVHQVRITIGGA